MSVRDAKNDGWPEPILKVGDRQGVVRPAQMIKGYMSGDGSHFARAEGVAGERLPLGYGKKAGDVITNG
jgi:hypothetical protein